VTINKVVTITEQPTVPVDVFFLVDTTGSMGGAIANVKAGFASIVAALSSVAPDIAFGVGEYKDSPAQGDPFAYRRDADITTNTATVQTGLNALAAGGGGDTPEANIYGLDQAATTTSWRAGSQRFVVWVGDAPGHNPSNGVNEATAIAALNAANVDVFAASVTSGAGGLNAACGGSDCTAGQAGRIVAGAGGQDLGLFDPSLVTSKITDALTTGITTYTSVGLAGVGVPAGVSVSFSPAISGSFDRSVERTFNFTATFTGVAPGTYSFDVDALLNGSTVAAVEADRITVGSPVPEPASLSLLGLGLAAAYRRRRAARAARA
jgi:hypothetical protein